MLSSLLRWSTIGRSWTPIGTRSGTSIKQETQIRAKKVDSSSFDGGSGFKWVAFLEAIRNPIMDNLNLQNISRRDASHKCDTVPSQLQSSGGVLYLGNGSVQPPSHAVDTTPIYSYHRKSLNLGGKLTVICCGALCFFVTQALQACRQLRKGA